jgi:ABC-2 type transport system ATP-binding protein
MLVLEDIVRSYRQKLVLDGADLRLKAGVVTRLTGANGAGKTTLLRVAIGLLAPERGSVLLDGLHPARDRVQYNRRLGYLPAGNGGLYARLTVAQQLALWADISFVPRAKRAERIEATIGRFALEPLRRDRVDRLSMGQRQRVRLAQAWLHDPDVVLLDEPQTSLDTDGLELLAQALDDHAAAGRAALWCGPDAASIGLRSDEALVVRDRRVVAE